MASLSTILRRTARAGLAIALLAAPIALAPSVDAGNHLRIEAPAQAQTGLGLVLLVSLQRA